MATECIIPLHSKGGDDDDDEEVEPQLRRRLSRPERKALERERKQLQTIHNANNNKRRQHHASDRTLLLTEDDDDGGDDDYVARGLLFNTTTATMEGRYKQWRQSPTMGTLTLTNATTAETVLRSIKRAQNSHSVQDLHAIAHFLLERTSAGAHAYDGPTRGRLLSRLTVAALPLQQHSLARTLLALRRSERPHGDRSSSPAVEAAALVRALLRVGNVTDAWDILNEELALPSAAADDDKDDDRHRRSSFRDNQDRSSAAGRSDRVRYRALALAAVAARHLWAGDAVDAVAACAALAETGPVARTAGWTAEHLAVPWTRLLRAAAHCHQCRLRGGGGGIAPSHHLHPTTTTTTLETNAAVPPPLPCNVAYAVLAAMATFPSNNDNDVYERLAHALVRRVVFVTGAVSMAGCPIADRGEACFIGRSNVGKSSLINMITNRKALAYISKRPGKTQQFNFFAVNDVPDKEKAIKYGDVVAGTKDVDSFYIVDLPGFGYAKVPEQQRNEWLTFMHEYLTHRKTLKVVFHLIDSRHGPTDEDAVIMKQVADTLLDKKRSVSYVIVLTKSDKNVKGGGGGTAEAQKKRRPGKVSGAVMTMVRDTMRDSGIANTAPIILSSAETKLGRDDLWRYLRKAAEA